MFHVYVEKFRCNKKMHSVTSPRFVPRLCRRCLFKNTLCFRLALRVVTNGAHTFLRSLAGPFQTLGVPSKASYAVPRTEHKMAAERHFHAKELTLSKPVYFLVK